MAKLSTSEYKQLRALLEAIPLPPIPLKAALSAANQVAVYQHYLEHKDINIITDYGSFTLYFSGLPQNPTSLTEPNSPVTRLKKLGKNTPEPVLPVPPPKTKTKTKTGYSVRLDDDEREELQKIADSFDVPLAQVLRWAVKDYLVNKRITT